MKQRETSAELEPYHLSLNCACPKCLRERKEYFKQRDDDIKSYDRLNDDIK